MEKIIESNNNESVVILITKYRYISKKKMASFVHHTHQLQYTFPYSVLIFGWFYIYQNCASTHLLRKLAKGKDLSLWSLAGLSLTSEVQQLTAVWPCPPHNSKLSLPCLWNIDGKIARIFYSIAFWVSRIEYFMSSV